MKALVNCDIFTPEGVLTKNAVLIENGVIVGLPPYNEVSKDYEIIDLGARSVMPGFIDLQVNGGNGHLLNHNADQNSLLHVLNAHSQLGTTSIFPTVFTTDLERMEQLLDSALLLQQGGETRIAGIHFEGPIINPNKAGVHDKEKISEPKEEILNLYERSAESFPTLVTLAPEVIDLSIIERLSNHGVIVFAGHTESNYEQMIQAFDSGVRGVTHLYNACSGLASREPGAVGAALEQDQAYFSIIVDGFHVHWASVNIALKSKPKGKAFLVTDAMPAVGFKGKNFTIGDLPVRIVNGRCETEEGVLAGSALDMISAVRNCVQKVGVPRPEAIKMATQYPAEFAGICRRIGRVEIGAPADLVVSDNEFLLHSVYVAGARVTG